MSSVVGVKDHDRFAHDQELVENFLSQYHVPPSGAKLVAVQAEVLKLYPKPQAIVILMQTDKKKTIASFVVPENYFTQRIFSSFIGPSFGPPERQDADMQRIQGVIQQQVRGKVARPVSVAAPGAPKTEEEEISDEGQKLITLLQKGIKERNEWILFVKGRMSQFIQA